MLRRRFLFSAASVALAACTGIASPSPSATDRPSSPNAGHPARNIWPTFLTSANAQTREAYLFASLHVDHLKYIPCYCGCAGSGHQNNADCFVRSRLAEGWMILEPHGAACGTCVGIALDTREMLNRGATLREIRTTIDKRWSGAGPGTNTPPP